LRIAQRYSFGEDAFFQDAKILVGVLVFFRVIFARCALDILSSAADKIGRSDDTSLSDKIHPEFLLIRFKTKMFAVNAQ